MIFGIGVIFFVSGSVMVVIVIFCLLLCDYLEKLDDLIIIFGMSFMFYFILVFI